MKVYFIIMTYCKEPNSWYRNVRINSVAPDQTAHMSSSIRTCTVCTFASSVLSICVFHVVKSYIQIL